MRHAQILNDHHGVDNLEYLQRLEDDPNTLDGQVNDGTSWFLNDN